MQGTEVVVSSGLILDVMGFTPLEQEQQQEGQQQVGTAEGQQQQQEATPQDIEEESLPPAYPIFTVTFNEPGAYPFFCAFHPGMTGVVNVTE
jgi:plastocyanin